MHHPPPGSDLVALRAGMHPAQRRLAFEELLAHHLALRGRRIQRDALSATPIPPSARLWPTLRGQLDFDLTGAQQRAIGEILADIAKAHPALRLVQGDVGSGKTIVAAAAVVAAVEAGQQAVVMAPTELLAEQHLAVFRSWLSPLSLEPVWLSGRLSQA